ncbi:MAG: hypothetical protein ER33_05005 [Cyanobium sp. CACIAM 14]|nr:MAG: hypothetical protein ER33_05005 [Cyanobium sp. CACIAM 14]
MTPILTATSTVLCPHLGQAQLLTSNTEWLIDGAPALLLSDVHPIVGCIFAPGGVYTPCVTVRWLSGATQANLHGVPVLLQNSVGLCLNAAQVPQGQALVVQVQTRAQGV